MFILRAIISAETELKVVHLSHQEDAVASWLVRSTPDRAVLVQALAEDIKLCSWARHLLTLTSFCTQKSLTVPLSIQVYKWVLANLMVRVTLRLTTQNSPKTFHYLESHLYLSKTFWLDFVLNSVISCLF